MSLAGGILLHFSSLPSPCLCRLCPATTQGAVGPSPSLAKCRIFSAMMKHHEQQHVSALQPRPRHCLLTFPSSSPSRDETRLPHASPPPKDLKKKRVFPAGAQAGVGSRASTGSKAVLFLGGIARGIAQTAPGAPRAPGRAAQPPPSRTESIIPWEPGSGGLLWKNGKSMAPEQPWQPQLCESNSTAVNPSASGRATPDLCLNLCLHLCLLGCRSTRGSAAAGLHSAGGCRMSSSQICRREGAPGLFLII